MTTRAPDRRETRALSARRPDERRPGQTRAIDDGKRPRWGFDDEPRTQVFHREPAPRTQPPLPLPRAESSSGPRAESSSGRRAEPSAKPSVEQRDDSGAEPRIVPWYDAEAAVAATTTDRFWGATIQLFHVEVLVVLVSMRLIGDRREAPIAVGAFQARFGRTIVLAAQGRDGRPTFFGPAPIAQVLGQIPFDALAWKRYRLSRPKPLMLPIPVDPPPESRVSWSDLHVIPGVKPHRAEPPARGGGTRELVEGDQKPETVPLRRPRSEISYVRTFVRDPERDQTRG